MPLDSGVLEVVGGDGAGSGSGVEAVVTGGEGACRRGVVTVGRRVAGGGLAGGARR